MFFYVHRMCYRHLGALVYLVIDARTHVKEWGEKEGENSNNADVTMLITTAGNRRPSGGLRIFPLLLAEC